MIPLPTVSRITLPLLVIGCLLTACAVPTSRSLSLGPEVSATGSDPALAVVLLHPFSEAFSPDRQLGRHRFSGDRQTKLLVHPGHVSRALDAILLQELTGQHIATARDGGDWDQTPAGLSAFTKPNRLLITGRITRLTINVEETLFSAKAQAEMEVECILGLITDKKVVRRRVHVAQEMVTVSFQQQDLENILRNCLSAASREILAQSDALLTFLPRGSASQPLTTQTDGKHLSTNNERTSQTEPGGNLNRTAATITGTFSLQGPLT